MWNDDWLEMEMRAINAIRLCLANEVMYSVLNKESAPKL